MGAEELTKLKEKIKENENSILQTNREISKLYLEEKVMRYILLQEELSKLTNENEKIKKKALELKQSMCNHRLLFFSSLYKERLQYQPSFMCLECGKQISGFMNDEQTCVNENQVTENDYGIFGDSMQYGKLHEKYENLQEQGLSYEKIKEIIEKEITNNKEKAMESKKLILRKK